MPTRSKSRPGSTAGNGQVLLPFVADHPQSIEEEQDAFARRIFEGGQIHGRLGGWRIHGKENGLWIGWHPFPSPMKGGTNYFMSNTAENLYACLAGDHD